MARPCCWVLSSLRSCTLGKTRLTAQAELLIDPEALPAWQGRAGRGAAHCLDEVRKESAWIGLLNGENINRAVAAAVATEVAGRSVRGVRRNAGAPCCIDQSAGYRDLHFRAAADLGRHCGAIDHRYSRRHELAACKREHKPCLNIRQRHGGRGNGSQNWCRPGR